MKINNFTLKFGKKIIIDHFSYEFTNAFFYNIYGPNGAGKSSFAKAIAGYIPFNGSVEMNSTAIGLVSSYTNIPAEVSVKDVIRFLKCQSDCSSEFQDSLYFMCNIENIITRKKVSMLSDGEKRKLAIYAALNCKKEVLILDEFTAGLDKTSSEEIRLFIKNLQQFFKLICLNVTHSIEDFRVFSGKILFLDSEIKSFTEIESLEELVSLL